MRPLTVEEWQWEKLDLSHSKFNITGKGQISLLVNDLFDHPSFDGFLTTKESNEV